MKKQKNYSALTGVEKSRLDSELAACARQMSHHTAANFQEMIRQRCRVLITLEHSTQLLASAR